MTAIDQWEFDQIRSAIDGLDNLARWMDRKWGAGRLRLLVSDELRAKFDRQRRKVDEAIWPAKGKTRWDAVRPAIEAMKRGWQVLDAQASGDGHDPIDPVIWEAVLQDGRTLALVRDIADASFVSATRDGRATVVWTLDEVARVVDANNIVSVVKQEFPGATVVAARDPTGDRPMEMDQDISDLTSGKDDAA